MPVRALRGATTLDDDTPEQIRERVKALIAALFERNELDHDDVISIFVTGHARHPLDVPGHGGPRVRARRRAADRRPGARHRGRACPRCVRVLLHVETDRPRSELHHVFLEGAVVLRPTSPDG